MISLQLPLFRPGGFNTYLQRLPFKGGLLKIYKFSRSSWPDHSGLDSHRANINVSCMKPDRGQAKTNKNLLSLNTARPACPRNLSLSADNPTQRAMASPVQDLQQKIGWSAVGRTCRDIEISDDMLTQNSSGYFMLADMTRSN